MAKILNFIRGLFGKGINITFIIVKGNNNSINHKDWLLKSSTFTRHGLISFLYNFVT